MCSEKHDIWSKCILMAPYHMTFVAPTSDEIKFSRWPLPNNVIKRICFYEVNTYQYKFDLWVRILSPLVLISRVDERRAGGAEHVYDSLASLFTLNFKALKTRPGSRPRNCDGGCGPWFCAFPDSTRASCRPLCSWSREGASAPCSPR